MANKTRMVSSSVWGRALAVFAIAVALLVSLGGCAAPSEDEESSDTPSKNRSYMAQVNQQMSDLNEVLTGFQAAVGEGDAVAMQASQVQAARIIDQVKSAEAPSMLATVKEGYVSGLEQLQQALGDYVQLYNDAQAGRLDEASFNSRLAQVQAAYDAGVKALADADKAAVDVANAGSEGSSSSSSSQQSSSVQSSAQQADGARAAAANAQAASQDAAASSAPVEAGAQATAADAQAVEGEAAAQAAQADEQAPVQDAGEEAAYEGAEGYSEYDEYGNYVGYSEYGEGEQEQ